MITHLHKRIAITVGLGIAAGIHLAVAASHELGSTHGTLFAITGLLQAALATRSARTLTRADAVAAAGSSALLLGIWIVDRLAVPGGEGPGVLDTTASVSELLTLVFCVSVLVMGAPGGTDRFPRAAVVGLVGIAGIVSFVAAPAGHGHHEVEHEAHDAPVPTRFDVLLGDHHEEGHPHEVSAPNDEHTSQEEIP